jgi:hypothetical protein
VGAPRRGCLCVIRRVKARYSHAYSEVRISAIVFTWKGPRSPSKHCHPARWAIARTGIGVGRHAEGEKCWPVTTHIILDEAAAHSPTGPKFRSRRIDLTPDPCSSSRSAKKLPALGGNGTAVPPISVASTSAASSCTAVGTKLREPQPERG